MQRQATKINAHSTINRMLYINNKSHRTFVLLGGAMVSGELEEEIQQVVVLFEWDTELVEEYNQTLLHLHRYTTRTRAQQVQERTDDWLVDENLLLWVAQ